MLLQQTYRPERTDALEKTLELLQQLEKTVRFYHLECNREPEAARIAFKAILSGERKDGNTVTTFEDELARSGRLVYRNAGSSMLPLIREGRDLIVLERCDGKDLPVFEVVLFRQLIVKGRGEYVLHRILKRDPDGNYQIAGDNCTTCETVSPEQILARLTEVKRADRTIRTSDLVYRAYVRLWCAPYPLRFRLLKAAGSIRKAGSKLMRKRKER